MVAAVLLGFSSTIAPVVALTSATALIMGGTSNPLSVPEQSQAFVDGYTYSANEQYIKCGNSRECLLVGAVTPEQFWPVRGDITFTNSVGLGREALHACIMGQPCHHTSVAPRSGTSTSPVLADQYHVFGYSQSGSIITLEKRVLRDTYATGTGPDVTFDIIGNPNRPSGGFLARGPQGLVIPILDVTFFGPTPTDTQYQTDDFTRQYDGWSDNPTNPINLLADINALLGIIQLHGDYFGPTVGEPILQDTYGDTTYYMIPTKKMPLVSWLDAVPTVGPFVATVLDAPLRVVVETGHDRTTSPGQPSGWNVFYTPNPLLIPVNFLIAIPTGWDDAISEAANDPSLRPFQTQPAGPYGVGGPPVTMPGAIVPVAAAQDQSAQPQSLAATVADDDTGATDPAGDTDVPDVNRRGARAAVADPGPVDAGTPDADKAGDTAGDTLKADAPPADTPAADAPKTDAPKTDAPKTDAPKTDARKSDAPKSGQATAEGPGADAVSSPPVDKPSRPKIRKPVGAEDPKVADRPSLRGIFGKPGKRAADPSSTATPAAVDSTPDNATSDSSQDAA